MAQTIKLPLTKGHTATIDEVDADLARFKWCSHVGPTGLVYAWRRPGQRNARRNEYLHRVILSRVLNRLLGKGEEVDHANGDPLDNRRSNLRLASRSENNRNQVRRKDNKTGYKGVYWERRRNYWYARITVNGRRIGRYSFRTAEEAHEAYCELARQYYGEFANSGQHEEAA